MNFTKVKVKETGEQHPVIDVPPPVNGEPVKSYFYFVKTIHRGSGYYADLTTHVEGMGTKMDGTDNPQMSAEGPVFKPWFYLYKIPWGYKINETEVDCFKEVEQKGELFALNGGFKFVISKAGAEAEVKNQQ